MNPFIPTLLMVLTQGSLGNSTFRSRWECGCSRSLPHSVRLGQRVLLYRALQCLPFGNPACSFAHARVSLCLAQGLFQSGFGASVDTLPAEDLCSTEQPLCLLHEEVTQAGVYRSESQHPVTGSEVAGNLTAEAIYSCSLVAVCGWVRTSPAQQA